MKILYEDSELIVVIKPAGLKSQSSSGFDEDMVSLIKKHIYDSSTGKTEPYVGVIHRLDTNVTGIMVYAKTKDAAASLSKQLTEGKIKKTYHAILCGQPKDNKGKLIDYLAKDEKENISRVVSEKDKNAKKAELDYRVLNKKYIGGRQLSKVEIDLITGRHHQIRVQFASRKMPVMGDEKYGGEKSNGLKLAAVSLSFTHPKTKKIMSYKEESLCPALEQ